MQFIKKNYEKILLGLVLFGLVVAVGFMVIVVANEKQKLRDLSQSIINRQPKALETPELTEAVQVLRRTDTRVSVDLSRTNKLFNPVRWIHGPEGLIKMERGSELEKLTVTDLEPLYLIIRLESVRQEESGPRYGVSVQQQAATKPQYRGRRTYYMSSRGETAPVAEEKDALTLKDIKGPPENPTALVFELAGSTEPVVVERAKPFTRIDGYTADLRFPPSSVFPNRRANDLLALGSIFAAGEFYNVVAINEDMVVLSARSNKKKYEIPVPPELRAAIQSKEANP